jgi:hypothetical protein
MSLVAQFALFFFLVFLGAKGMHTTSCSPHWSARFWRRGGEIQISRATAGVQKHCPLLFKLVYGGGNLVLYQPWARRPIHFK